MTFEGKNKAKIFSKNITDLYFGLHIKMVWGFLQLANKMQQIFIFTYQKLIYIKIQKLSSKQIYNTELYKELCTLYLTNHTQYLTTSKTHDTLIANQYAVVIP